MASYCVVYYNQALVYGTYNWIANSKETEYKLHEFHIWIRQFLLKSLRRQAMVTNIYFK